MLPKIGGTLKRANDALADAQKSWRDENLTSREREIAQREGILERREADLNRRVKVLQRGEWGKWLRRTFIGAAMLTVAVVSFLAGATTTGSETSPASVRPVVAPQSESLEPPSRDAPAATILRKAGSFRECVTMGEEYFREIDAWPRLSSGEDAAATAADRCARTLGAFDDY